MTDKPSRAALHQAHKQGKLCKRRGVTSPVYGHGQQHPEIEAAFARGYEEG